MSDDVEQPWPRDPAASRDQRADCCHDAVTFIAEIPRTATGYGNWAPPARFRLCWHHGEILRSKDPAAMLHPIWKDAARTR